MEQSIASAVLMDLNLLSFLKALAEHDHVV